MQEQIQTYIAALNTVFQRYASAAGERLAPVTADALNRDYIDAWERLEAYGITEEMLAYDPETMMFSLPAQGEQTDHLFTTMPLPAVMNQAMVRQRPPGDPDTEQPPTI